RGGAALAGDGGTVVAAARNNLTANASGFLLKSSDFTGADVTLSAADHQAGNITVSGSFDVGFGDNDKLSLVLNHTGTIIQTSGVLAGHIVNLSNPEGGIGRNTFAVSTRADVLTVNGGGSAFVTNIGSVELGSGSAVKDLVLTSSGTIFTTG